ncbi:MAG: alpha/beta hydrolase [Elusimicrobia bacterium RIFOXYD2_FULL_34_15]|nr:MAG: alpha/beta hydrolase [Elusimicrobia bacterium RIFOXYD2_FULL_34_15]
MKNIRKYGKAPFSVAVIHGGPGASGEMAPVAKALSSYIGVLEPLQTKSSINEQVEELKTILKKKGDLSIILIGYSWGAMLGFIFTSKYPEFVKKLILVSSGVFEEKYALNIMKNRLNRLNKKEREEVLSIIEKLNNSKIKDKNTIMVKFGNLISKADSFDPMSHGSELIKCDYDIHQKIWKQAVDLRSSGKLLKFGEKIKCPVTAIHGDYDPHQYKGLKDSLSKVLKDFRFILIKKCGHKPWIEKKAKCEFYEILKKEICLNLI